MLGCQKKGTESFEMSFDESQILPKYISNLALRKSILFYQN